MCAAPADRWAAPDRPLSLATPLSLAKQGGTGGSPGTSSSRLGRTSPVRLGRMTDEGAIGQAIGPIAGRLPAQRPQPSSPHPG